MIQFLQYGPRFTLSDDARFRALMLKIVENTLRNQHDRFTARRREIARERPLPPDTVLPLDPPEGEVNTPSQSVERRENEAWIRMGMEFLDPKDRELIVLRQWDKLTFVEIGERLGITETAARLRHRRTVSRLGEKVWALRSGKLDRLVE
jgi:RNA polymerase sigma factor (sigma-70 family)